MIKYENHCCDCAVPGYPCLGESCELRHVPVYVCDRCEWEIEGDVYEDEGYDDLCEECLKAMHKKREV